MRLLLATTILVCVVSGVVSGQQAPAKPKPRTFSVEVFQVVGLPLNVQDAVVVEKGGGYLLQCRLANESASEIVGFRYSLTILDPVLGARLLANRTEGFGLDAYGSKKLTFVNPIKFKHKDGDRLILMLEQVLSPESIWEVVKAKDALDSYVKGDYSVQPTVMRVPNQVDVPPQIRVIN